MTDLIGIATWNFREGTLAERVGRFASIGYNAVSLNTTDARLLMRGELPEAEAAIVTRQLAVTIHGGLAPKDQPIPIDDILADFRAYTDWQARTGLLVSVNYDGVRRQDDAGVWHYQGQEMHDVLAEMLSYSASAGFTVGIEDWPRCAEDLEWVSDLRKHGHYGMLIDLGHLNMRIREPDDPDYPFPLSTAEQYLDGMVLPVNELHIHNNNGRRDQHGAPEMGTSDLPAIAGILAATGKLAARGPRCVSTIELVPAWCGLTEEEGWAAAPEALDFWRGVADMYGG